MLNAPFVEGRRTRVGEMKAIEFNDGGAERRWFSVTFDNPYLRSVVVMGGLLKPGNVLCSEHGQTDSCDCKNAVAAFIEETK